MTTTLQTQYIEIEIENERYALNICDIHEIIKMQDITEIPNSKSYVIGIINLRGKIVPVVSLRNRFGLPEASYSKSTRIVVVNYANEMIGIVVDRVNRVATFANMQPPSERIGDVQDTYFAGIGFTETGLVGVLKLEHVLHE